MPKFHSSLKKPWGLVSFGEKSGFTLVELVTVIAIIAVILAIGASFYFTAQRNARDSQRKTDLKKIQLALENFYAENGAYPNEATGDKLTCNTKSNDEANNVAISWGSTFYCRNSDITYLSALPQDPLTEDKYIYEVDEDAWCSSSSGGNCQSYTLWAKLENKQDPARYISSGTDTICNTVIGSGAPNSNNSWYTSSPGTTWLCVHP